jgi:hypothetical protein
VKPLFSEFTNGRKNMRFAGALMVAAFLFIPGTSIPAEGQTAKDVVKRHVAALGGAEALGAIETMKYLRTVQNTELGKTTLQSRTVFLSRRPLFYRSERSETGSFYISDGSKAWSGRRRSNTDMIEWDEPRFVLALRDIDFDRPFGSFLDYDRKGHSARYVGKTELDGVILQKVHILWSDGTGWEYYFDSSTGLCYGWDASPGEPGGLTRVDDYRRVGNVLIPHRNAVTDTLPDGSVRIHERLYSDFEFNLEIPESLFRPWENRIFRNVRCFGAWLGPSLSSERFTDTLSGSPPSGHSGLRYYLTWILTPPLVVTSRTGGPPPFRSVVNCLVRSRPRIVIGKSVSNPPFTVPVSSLAWKSSGTLNTIPPLVVCRSSPAPCH